MVSNCLRICSSSLRSVSTSWAAAGEGTIRPVRSRPMPTSDRMDASLSRDSWDRPAGGGPAGGDYGDSARGLGETGGSAGIGEAGDGVGVSLGEARGTRADDERAEVGR